MRYLLLPGVGLVVGSGLGLLLPLRLSATYPHFQQVLDVAGRHLRRVPNLLRLSMIVTALRRVRRLLLLWSVVLLLAARVRGVPPEEPIRL